MEISRYLALALAVPLFWTSPCWSSPTGIGAPPQTTPAEEDALHRRRAVEYLQEVEQLEQAIERYQVMEQIYSVGSRGSSPGFNYSGRRDMIERIKRVIAYFTQEEQQLEEQAAQEERLAQSAEPS
jgi:hypothetical protein